MNHAAVILFVEHMIASAMKAIGTLRFGFTKEAGVATIPVSVFYHDDKDDKVLAFLFFQEKRNLEAALND